MAVKDFLDLIKELTAEFQKNPRKILLARENCNGRKTFDDIFSYVWQLDDVQRILNPQLLPEANEKSEQEADRLRSLGNTYYAEKKLQEALEQYNASIMRAPHPVLKENLTVEGKGKYKSNDYPLISPKKYGGVPEGESKSLALAFANRSAILIELQQYEKCIKDIEWAFEYGYPEAKREKLDQRKEKCLKLMRESPRSAKARRPFIKVVTAESSTYSNGDDLQRNFQSKLVMSDSNEDLYLEDLVAYKLQKPPKYKPNPKVPAHSSLVNISFDKANGRYLTAAAYIKPGDVIGVEEAYCVNIQAKKLHIYCSHCLSFCLTPLPCPGCSKVIFCSEECRLRGLSMDHWLECRVLPTLIAMDLPQRNLAIKMLKTMTYQHLSEILVELNEEDSRKQPNENTGCYADGMYLSDSYRPVYYFCSNKEHCSFEFLLMQAEISVILVKLILQSGRFFVDKEGNNIPLDKEVIRRIGGVLTSHLTKLHCNPFQYHDIKLDEHMAAGVSSALSLTNHSCYPNVRYYSVGKKVVMRAIRPIRAGEELTISYSKEFHRVDIKLRTETFKMYHFSCKCVACKNKWPVFDELPDMTFSCLTCNSVLEDQPKHCDDCLKKYGEEANDTKQLYRKEGIEKLYAGMMNASRLEVIHNEGGHMTKDDYMFLSDHIDHIFKFVVMPCKHITKLQNLLSKCFDDGH